MVGPSCAGADLETVTLAVAAAALGTCEATGSAHLARAVVAAVWAVAAGASGAPPSDEVRRPCDEVAEAEHFVIGDDACSVATCCEPGATDLPSLLTVVEGAALPEKLVGSLTSEASFGSPAHIGQDTNCIAEAAVLQQHVQVSLAGGGEDKTSSGCLPLSSVSSSKPKDVDAVMFQREFEVLGRPPDAVMHALAAEQIAATV